MNDSNNPLSPHLQIYRWHISSLLSITHRIAGVINLLALILIFFWLVVLSLGENNYELFLLIINSFLGKSILIGLAIVFVFMLVYYKLSGGIANLALVWNIVLILAVLASLGATLTLPGIAGLILTVGMCIDANVIIFERIREELKKGKTPKSAIEGGYNRAITTIIDANLTTVIAALVLYQFGTGPIKGFAVTLSIGIFSTIFSNIVFTRVLTRYLINPALLSGDKK